MNSRLGAVSMRRVFHFLALSAAAALGLGLSACSSDDSGANTGGVGAGGGSGGAGAGGTGANTGGVGAGGGSGGTGAGGTGAGGTSAGGSGSASATYPPTCPKSAPCSQSKGECVNGCAITCAQYQGQFALFLGECSAFGTCAVQQTSIGPVALCSGDGIGSSCNSSYAARCEGNVAFNCEVGKVGKVAVTYCATDAECWSEGEHAGCRADPLACGKLKDGTKCGGGPDSVPCCPGFVCAGSSCLLPAGSECESILDCNIGLACRTKANGIPKTGEKGLCEKPTCALPNASAPSETERCSRLPGVPCCIAGTSCGSGWTGDQCCFSAGVVPKIGNTVDASLCCNVIGTDVDDKCQ